MITFVVKMMAISLMPVGIMVKRSYDETLMDVNGLALMYPGAFVLFVLPGSYFIHKYGLRNGVLLGSVLTTFGAFVKIYINHSYHWIVIGQGIGAIG